TIYGTIFAAIGGTLLYIALAAPSTKVWDSQADFDAPGNTKQNITTTADGKVTLTPTSSGGGNYSFQRSTIESGTQIMDGVASGDINGDGKADIVLAGGSYLAWYDQPSWTKRVIATSSGTGRVFGAGAMTVVKDINGDGRNDVVTGNQKTLEELWFENTGSGWTPHVMFSGSKFHDIAFGDFNGDGKTEALAVDQYSNKRVALLTPGSDIRQPWNVNVVASGNYMGIATGDINKDGKLDFVTGRSWFRNNGGNPTTFTKYAFTNLTPSSSASYFTDFSKVDLLDMNGDGKLDIFAIIFAESLEGRAYAFLQPSDPTQPWTSTLIDQNLYAVHSQLVASFDGSSKPQIMVGESNQAGFSLPPKSSTPNIYMYRLIGSPASSSGWEKTTIDNIGTHEAALGDFNGDGKPDFAGHLENTTTANAQFHWWGNNTVATRSLDQWQRAVIDDAKPWRAVFIESADIDRDGKKDLVAGGWWYKNPGTPSGTWTRNTIGAPLNNMAAVYDFDSDGDLDILGTQGQGSDSNANFAWARNDGSGGFTVLTNIASADGDFLQGVEVARFNSSGPLEVALSWHAANKGIQTLTVPTNPSTGTWTWKRVSTTSQDEQLSTGDIDRDGDLDLALGTKWLRNDAGTWTTFTLSNDPGMPDRNRLVDMNGDGRLDIVVGYEAISIAGKLAWYEQPATATAIWTEHIIGNPVGPMSLDVADLDGDADLDVSLGEHNLSNPASAKLLVFENTNHIGTTWSSHTVYTGDEHHDGARLTDIDNDGDLDIMSIGWGHNQVLLYENRAALSGSTTTYPSTGSLTLPFDATTGSKFTGFGSTSTAPSGTSITYEARSSCDNTTWSNWGSVNTVPDGRYLQLKANLSTTNSSTTPTVDKLSINHEPTSACSPTQTKTWDSQADFDSGTKDKVSTNQAGTFNLTPSTVTSGTFQSDGVHMFMTDAEAAQMKKNIDDPSKPEIKRAYDNTKKHADGCGSAAIPPDLNDGLAFYRAMAGTGQCIRDSAIAYKYSGNKAYADKVVSIILSWTSVDPNAIQWGGPGRDEVMAMYFYGYDLTREVFTTDQTAKVQGWAQRWFLLGKAGMGGVVNSPWVDYAAWGNSGSWSIMVAYIGAVFSGNQSNIDYVIKDNPIIVIEAEMEKRGNDAQLKSGTNPIYIPYHLHCGNYGPNLPEIDPDVNGQPYTLKTALIGMITREGEMTGDCRHSIWYASFTLWGLQVMADAEQHRHDTSVWGPSGDPWQWTNVPGGQPKLKLAYEWLAKFLGNHQEYPWGIGYDHDQYTYVGSTLGQCGPITAIGDAAFVCEEMSHYNEIYARMEAAYNHYPSSQNLRDTVNATNMPNGFASNTNLNGRALNNRGDRHTYHISSYGAVVGDLGPASSSEATGTPSSITSYPPTGSLTLSHDAGQGSHFSGFVPTLSGSLPAGTNVTYEARSSCDQNTWTPWGTVNTVPDGRYLQLRANLSTTDPTKTPVVDKLSISHGAVSGVCGTGTVINNLAPNASFETDPAGVYTSSTFPGSQPSTFTWASDAAHTGAKSLKIASTQPAGSGSRFTYSTGQGVKAGNKYKASIWLKTAAVTDKAAINLRFFSAPGVAISQVTSPAVTGTNDWKETSIEGTAPAGTTLIYIELIQYGPGTSWGDDVALVDTSTTPIPPDTTAPTIPTGLSVQAPSTTTTTLNWAASTDPTKPGETTSGLSGYLIYRNGEAIPIAATDQLSFTDTDLTPETTYSYTVSAIDNAGNESQKTASVSITTPAPPDITKPTVPTNLTANAASPTKVDLNWTASTDNVAVTGYKLYRQQVGQPTCQTIGCDLLATVGNVTSYSDSSAAASTAYTYTVAAIDGAIPPNESDQSSPVSVTTPAPPDITPPSTPTNLTATTPNPTTVNLSWSAATDNVAVVGYKLFRGQGSITPILLTTTGTATTYS
ncbi:MAG: FG-GAP-like repeat-containing protein, partial [Dehalococcoidia bacterium]|nr:FG-GAP-like repeat-containing protein [Dehalococcoidia bacterium]